MTPFSRVFTHFPRHIHMQMLPYSTTTLSISRRNRRCFRFRRLERLGPHDETLEDQDPEDVQATVVVLARHPARLPQHLHRRRRALQPTPVANRLPM